MKREEGRGNREEGEGKVKSEEYFYIRNGREEVQGPGNRMAEGYRLYAWLAAA